MELYAAKIFWNNYYNQYNRIELDIDKTIVYIYEWIYIKPHVSVLERESIVWYVDTTIINTQV